MPEQMNRNDDATARVYQGAAVVRIDAAKAKVKAQIPGWGIESPWLRIAFPACKGYQHYWIPKVGDKGLVVLNQAANKGMWIASNYNDRNAPPYDNPDLSGWKHKDGTEDYYDASEKLRKVTTPGDIETHADLTSIHTAGERYEVKAPFVQLCDDVGASLTITGGQIVFENAAGQRWTFGGAGGSNVWECDVNGADVRWLRVGDFRLNGDPVTTMGHRHPDTGSASQRGYTPESFSPPGIDEDV
ncbi:MAG: phage baseplate assembly protein V [Cyanobacteria bacterium SBC]|nr:phage baseplate assembly protein V [Cyanobacteria bacterium SBC]